MAVSCSNCGGSHPVWDCREKSTGTSGGELGSSFRRGSTPRNGNGGSIPPPVDTNQASGDNVTAHMRSPDAVTGKFDKKAWSREYMAGYMKQYRAEVKDGTRIPKRKGEK